MSTGSKSAPGQSGAPDGGERRSLQLLVIDDDAVLRRLISVAAKQAGHAVTVAPIMLGGRSADPGDAV